MEPKPKMTDDTNKLLREKELAFFGAVTASLSHEINNVVAIVGQLAGLLDDLLYAAQQGRPLNEEKLKEISVKLSSQVDKGKTIIKRLNRFAHSVDEPLKQVDLKELLQLISVIAERFAFLREVKLKADFDGMDSIAVATNPFSLLQAVFFVIQLLLSVAGKNDSISIGMKPEKDGVKILLAGPGIVTDDSFKSPLDFLSLLMKELGGKFDIASAPNAEYSIALSIPRTPRSDSSRVSS
jgi:C4-dicarboxylate-specific signal transduction histidine kinase